MRSLQENATSLFLFSCHYVSLIHSARLFSSNFQPTRMKPIQLPEPPSPTAARGTPDIFESGLHTIVRRAVIIGNGFPSSENHSIGLLRALGLSHNHLIYVRYLFSVTIFQLTVSLSTDSSFCCSALRGRKVESTIGSSGFPSLSIKNSITYFPCFAPSPPNLSTFLSLRTLTDCPLFSKLMPIM